MSDMQDRLRAAHAWNDWESTHISLDPNWVPINQLFDEEQGLAFATLVAHYWSNDGFLQNGKEILSRVSTIGHIPAVLIHGRRDISGPVMTAWRLHRLWRASRLCVVESEGHGGPQSMEQMRIALDLFTRRMICRGARRSHNPPKQDVAGRAGEREHYHAFERQLSGQFRPLS